MNRRRIDPIVQDWITEITPLHNWTAAEIWREVENRIENFKPRDDDPRIPVNASKRTVERIVSEIRGEAGPVPESGTTPVAVESLWELTGDDPEAVFNILEVRRQLTLKYRRPLPRFTIKEANDLKVVFGAAPGIPPYCAYLVVQLYNQYQLSKDQTGLQALEDYLAFRPWKGGRLYDRYVSEVEAGVVTRVPAWDALVTPFDGWHTEEDWQADESSLIDEFLAPNFQ